MVELLHVLRSWGAHQDARAAMSDDNAVVARGELAARVAGMAEELQGLPQVVGLLGTNGTDWAVAQLAAWIAGKTVVPLPTFFSPSQLAHVLRDAAASHISLRRGMRSASQRRSASTRGRSPTVAPGPFPRPH